MASRKTIRTAEKRAAAKAAGKGKGTSSGKSAGASKVNRKAGAKPAATVKPGSENAVPALPEVRARIDSIDREIQQLIAERARFAQQDCCRRGERCARSSGSP